MKSSSLKIKKFYCKIRNKTDRLHSEQNNYIFTNDYSYFIIIIKKIFIDLKCKFIALRNIFEKIDYELD